MNGFLELVAEAGPGVAIRATVLFVVASLVSLVMARASAAQRHLVWAAALMGAMVLPAIHAWGPEWSVWPAGMTYRYGATSERGREATRLDRTMVDDRLQVDPLLHDPVPDEPADDDDQTTTAAHAGFSAAGDSGRVEATSPAIAMPAGSSRTVSLAHGLAAVWLVGMFYGCARLAVAYAGIRQLARHADPAGERTAAMIAELAGAAGIRRRVRGLVSRESIVPMTWGWLRPVVLLPVEAGSWSAERLRVVLQHELAHVSRWDALTQFVAELTRSVYWFHPLAWWSVRRLRADQEAACDDCVLAAGAAADDYAEELLVVTARLPRGAYGLQGMGVAVAMGRAGRLEERVRALLAFDRDRRPVNPWRAAAVASVFAAVATLAAVIGPAADAEDKATNSPAEPSASADDELPADTNKIESLTPEQADRLICKHERPGKRSVTFLRFKQVTELRDGIQITKAVRWECDGTIAFRGDFLSLPALKQITPETAAVLGRHHGVLHLDGMRALDAAVASALAAFDGELLSLHGLEEMDVAVAEALAGSQARRLNLNGLTTLDADAAEALAEFRGDEISMSRVWGMIGKSIALTAGVSRMVCKSGDSSCILEGVTALDAPDSVATAKALATRKGPLSLPNLKKISPKTLSALLEKGDVEIPLIETLELIPEPDGSPTDDFVIPEGVQERQKRQAR